MSLSDIASSHRCLAILRVLADAPDYAANASILTDAVNAVGLRAARHQVESDLSYLAEIGAVKLEDLGGLTIATATRKGADAAAGRATLPGVKRPSPRD